MSDVQPEINRRILVCDDNQAIHDDFRKILGGGPADNAALEEAEAALFGEANTPAAKETSFEVDSAHQGEEGLAKVQQARQAGKPYAMVFMDVRMPPGWDGIETTAKIWEVDPDVQIVICTAYSDYSWDEMISKLGHSDRLLILKKPFDTVEALQLAHALTEKWRLTQSSRRKLDDLDQTVRERNQQLETSNTALQAEIAERERAAKAMRESEERFRCLSACSPVGIMLTDTAGRCTYANPHCRTIFGLDSLMSFVGDGWLNLVHTGERAAVAGEWVKCARSGLEFKREVRLQWKSGEIRWVQIQSAPMFSDAGTSLGYVVSIADFTDRRRAEETLRHSEEHFRTLIENASDIITIVNPEGKVRYASPSVERVLGYRPDELLGQDAFALVHQDDREEMIRGFAAGGQTPGRTAIVEYRLHHKDGSWRIMESVSKNLIQDETIHSTIITSRDISERKRTDEVLRETNDTLQALVQASPIAITVLDTEGKVKLWNPNAEQVFGWKAEEVLGQMLPTVPPEKAQEHAALREQVLRGEAFAGKEVQRCTKSGRTLDINLSTAPLRNAAGQTCGVVGVMVDITERKQLEQQYRQAQRMEAVGKLAGGVAHDFNNILTAIGGYTELTLRAMAKDEPKRSNLEEIKKAADRAAGLTRQLLAFSRKQALQPKVLSLNATLAELEKMLQRLIGEDIELVTTSHGTPGQVRADPGQIEQVIMNLAVNARDAMPKGGKLTIEIANTTLDEAYARQHDDVKAGEYVQLSVTDTGTGMKPEVKARLFEPFFTTKEVGKGTGLGLATCYGIIKQSGGHMSVQSELGHGSTFNIYLPVVKEAAAVASATGKPAETPTGKETVLIVEDDVAVRMLATQVLRGLGYTVLEAGNGVEALEETAKRNGQGLDLIITDVIMPQMGGKELADRLKEKYATIKILFSSGYTDDAIGRQGILDEGTQFLQKPYSREKLAHKVREVLDLRA